MLLDFLVHSFSLTISLGVESSGWGAFDPNKTIEFFHESGYKLGASVRDNFVLKTMEAEDMISEETGRAFCRKVCFITLKEKGTSKPSCIMESLCNAVGNGGLSRPSRSSKPEYFG